TNRRARLIVDLAGPMVEVALGSAAMLGAYSCDLGVTQALLFGTGVLLWESALINLYPFSFLELDGYNILADLLVMPMLRKQALALIPSLPQRLRNPRMIQRAEWIQIGYLVLCFFSVFVYLVLHLDAIRALLPSRLILSPYFLPRSFTLFSHRSPSRSNCSMDMPFSISQRLKPYSLVALPYS